MTINKFSVSNSLMKNLPHKEETTFLRYYFFLSFGTYFSLSSFCLTLCVGLYVLDKMCTSSGLEGGDSEEMNLIVQPGPTSQWSLKTL